MAQLVEHNLAKVGAAGSSPVSRFHIKKKSDSKKESLFFCFEPRRGSKFEVSAAVSVVAKIKGRRKNAYVYLLDEAMQMDKIGLISTNLAEKIAMTVTESPYRVTAETISNTCGQSISSGGGWHMAEHAGQQS